MFYGASSAARGYCTAYAPAAISYGVVGCAGFVAAAVTIELAVEVYAAVVDAAVADEVDSDEAVADAAVTEAAKFAAAVATLGYSTGAYQFTGPPAAAAPAPSLALALAAGVVDADTAVAAVVSLAAAVVDPPAFASSRARVRSSAIFLRSASSSY